MATQHLGEISVFSVRITLYKLQSCRKVLYLCVRKVLHKKEKLLE
jgi:hypothetical protein